MENRENIWVDLTIPISENIPRWKLQFDAVYNTNSYMTSSVSLGLHTATHLDSPLHYVPGAMDIAVFPTEWIHREADILDLTYVTEDYPIDLSDVKSAFQGSSARTVLLRTDWDRKYWGSYDYWNKAPYVTERAAEFIAEQKIDVIGYDFPQEYVIRKIATENPSYEKFYVHRILTAKNIWQLEYVCNLRALKARRVELILAPLPFIGREASPARVLARDL